MKKKPLKREQIENLRKLHKADAYTALCDFAKRLRSVVPEAPEEALFALAMYDPETRSRVECAKQQLLKLKVSSIKRTHGVEIIWL